MQRPLTLVLLLASLALLAVRALPAQTIHVPRDVKTIQAAIDKAVHGQTILVAPGIYKERIDFKGKAVTVAGRDGAVATTLDGEGKGSVVTFRSSESTSSVLTGFTICNGSGTPDSYQNTSGGGIYCSLASPTIRGNIVTANHAHVGGGIRLVGSQAVVVTNTVYRNSAQWSGAGLSCGPGAHAIVVANLIADNFEHPASRALVGGGIHCDNAAPYIGHNTITGNIGGYGGGGIYCCNSSPRIDRNVVFGNRVLGSQFRGLSNEAGGAGIYAESDSTPAITANLIVGNICPYETYGGGIALWWAGPHLVTSNLIAGNRAAYGGGIWLSQAGGAFTNNTVYGNQATSGGGFAYRGYTGNPRITNTILWNNRAVTAAEIEGDAGLTISDSVVDGGKKSTVGSFTWGNDVLDVDPKFVDAAGLDFHLLYTSPCRDRGANTAPQLPTTDFEGDPRTWPVRPDLGADEFHPRVYASGQFTRGGTVVVRVVGVPTTWATLGISANPRLRVPPLSIPGHGVLYLDHPAVAVPLGVIPAAGITTLRIPIPASLPTPATIPIQAALLAGPSPSASLLTNPWIVSIR